MKIFLLTLVSCIIYSILSHYFMSVSYQGLNAIQSGARSFAIYSTMFLIYATLPIVVSLFVAKLPKANRCKPYLAYFQIALIVTWVFALIGLYFGWYAVQATNS